MSDPLVFQNGKLNTLNKKIIEIKKKIQLSEGQRKANFEECDAAKRECAERIARLKREVKELQLEFAKTKTNEEATELAAAGLADREATSACAKKRNLQEAIATLDEDSIRLRKKLDLIKYQSNKKQKQLTSLLQQYEELMNGKPKKLRSPKPSARALKKQIVRLENQLHRMSVMQMEADTVRKKYRAVRSSLKADASSYASCLDGLEENIREQENEIKRLQKVKVEAIELRDTTKETLTKQELEALHTTKERETVIQEYRKRVEERKLELERLERAMFSTTGARSALAGPSARDDLDTATAATGRKSSPRSSAAESPDTTRDSLPPQCEIDRLEETFAMLRNATGVSKTEEVLERFLAQRNTREKLKRMQATAEEEKMQLEKQRQQLSAEIEMHKFSETKDADQTADKLEQLNKQIEEQKLREENAISEIDKLKKSFEKIGQLLYTFYHKFQGNDDVILTDENPEITNPTEILFKLNDKINEFIEKIGGPEKYNELSEQVLSDKFEVMSLETTSEHTKQINVDDQPLFPLFRILSTPAAQIQISEDEEDIPSRSLLKRQAQLLVDTKSRRKGFAFKR